MFLLLFAQLFKHFLEIHLNMHIIYIITKLELGGAQKVCLALHKGLKDTTISSTLISGDEGALVPQVAGDSSTILLRSFKREISIRGIINEFSTFFTLVKALRTLKKHSTEPIIVHTHSTKAGILGRWAAFFAGIRIRVHTVHGFAFHEHQSWPIWLIIVFFEWITALITTHFVVVSSKDQETGTKYLPRFKNNHSIIRAAAFTRPKTSFQKAQKTFNEENPCILGTVSCFKPQKNLSDLLHILAKLITTVSPHFRLEIVGDGSERIMLENLAQKLGISNFVFFAGWQSDIAPWLARWDIFTLTSLWEGLPCSTIEARLFKLPIVAYNTGGIKDVILPGQNGFLVPQHDKASFVIAVQKCFERPEMHQQLSAFPDSLEDFTIEAMINQHIKLYRILAR